MSDLMAGKVVVVTGGAAGIGRATAVAFARRGASVMIGDIDSAGAENTVAAIRDNGGEASCVRVDVSKAAEVQHMITGAVTQYGGLDYAFKVEPTPMTQSGIDMRASAAPLSRCRPAHRRLDRLNEHIDASPTSTTTTDPTTPLAV